MAWEKFDNIKGPKGDKGPAGTISSVTSATVPPGTPARASITGKEDVNLHLELPQGERGEQGPPGVASSASARTVAYGEPAKVILEQHGELVHMGLEIPAGAPGVNAVPTDEAVGAYLAADGSASKASLVSVMTGVAADPDSDFAQAEKERLDTALVAKADLEGGKVPDAQIGAAQTATAGTIPKRTTSGRLPGIGSPTAAGDATNKTYVDSGILAVDRKRDPHVTTAELSYLGSRYTRTIIHTDGVRPGMLRKSFGKGQAGGTGTSLMPPPENIYGAAIRLGATYVGNADGWFVEGNTGELKGAQILNGVVYHDMSASRKDTSDSIGILADGTFKCYSAYRRGDTAAKMLADGVTDSFSFGPCLVENGVRVDITGAFWVGFTDAVGGRQAVGQKQNGDIVIITVNGSSGSTGLTGAQLQDLVINEGLYNAINLDGGGSAQSYFNGAIINASSDTGGARGVRGLMYTTVAAASPSCPDSFPIPFRTGYTHGSHRAEIQVLDGGMVASSGQIAKSSGDFGATNETIADYPAWLRPPKSVLRLTLGAGTSIRKVQASSAGIVTTPASNSDATSYITIDGLLWKAANIAADI